MKATIKEILVQSVDSRVAVLYIYDPLAKVRPWAKLKVAAKIFPDLLPEAEELDLLPEEFEEIATEAGLFKYWKDDKGVELAY